MSPFTVYTPYVLTAAFASIDHTDKIAARIKSLEDRYFKIKDSIGNRRKPSEYLKKSRGRLMRHIEKEWQFEKAVQKWDKEYSLFF